MIVSVSAGERETERGKERGRETERQPPRDGHLNLGGEVGDRERGKEREREIERKRKQERERRRKRLAMGVEGTFGPCRWVIQGRVALLCLGSCPTT